MKIHLTDLVYLLSPALVGYGMQSLCKLDKNAGKTVKFRPPSYVFGIAWPILFLLLGIAFMMSMRRKNTNKNITLVLYSMLILSLGLWIYSYGCKDNKINSLWILMISFTLALSCFTISEQETRLMLCPLIGWLLFAILMNKTEIQ